MILIYVFMHLLGEDDIVICVIYGDVLTGKGFIFYEPATDFLALEK